MLGWLFADATQNGGQCRERTPKTRLSGLVEPGSMSRFPLSSRHFCGSFENGITYTIFRQPNNVYGDDMARILKPSSLRDPLDSVLDYQMRLASMATLSVLVDSLTTLGLRPIEGTVIRFVEANPGCNQGEIGRALGVKRTNMVPIISGLVEAGLISRSAANGRTHALRLTKKGSELDGKVAQKIREHETRFFGDLDDTTKAILLKTLRLIRAKAGD